MKPEGFNRHSVSTVSTFQPAKIGKPWKTQEFPGSVSPFVVWFCLEEFIGSPGLGKVLVSNIQDEFV